MLCLLLVKIRRVCCQLPFDNVANCPLFVHIKHESLVKKQELAKVPGESAAGSGQSKEAIGANASTSTINAAET